MEVVSKVVAVSGEWPRGGHDASDGTNPGGCGLQKALCE